MPKFKVFYRKGSSHQDLSCGDNYIIIEARTELEARRWSAQIGHIVIKVEHL
jgi:hypothetical protein